MAAQLIRVPNDADVSKLSDLSPRMTFKDQTDPANNTDDDNNNNDDEGKDDEEQNNDNEDDMTMAIRGSLKDFVILLQRGQQQ